MSSAGPRRDPADGKLRNPLPELSGKEAAQACLQADRLRELEPDVVLLDDDDLSDLRPV